jgi:cupin fold WbuC family metalloprotein
MIKIYSNINKELLLHQVNRFSETEGRINLCSDDSFIQCAYLNMSKGTTFKPHKHNTRKRIDEDYIPQESWVVIRGEVQCIFYDIDDSIISTVILKKGDASFTFHGGHNYCVLSKKAIVYEYKTGKYEGQSIDKTFI